MIEIRVKLPNLFLGVPLFLFFNRLITIQACKSALFLTLPAKPVIQVAQLHMLVDAGYALHVILTPCLRYMSNLNLDYLCSIFAEVSPREFVDELLHYQAALVLNKE